PTFSSGGTAHRLLNWTSAVLLFGKNVFNKLTHRPSGWTTQTRVRTARTSYKWEAVDPDNKVKYTIKLCESSPPTSCGSSAAVCAQNLSGGVGRSVGEYSGPKHSVASRF
ncbi:hypothetical protein AMECASPLE_035860, partial [Ameca splendens]